MGLQLTENIEEDFLPAISRVAVATDQLKFQSALGVTEGKLRHPLDHRDSRVLRAGAI